MNPTENICRVISRNVFVLQLIITISFNQNVKVHSLKIHAPDDGTAPKTVKVFANLPNTMDFDQAERSEPIQTLE